MKLLITAATNLELAAIQENEVTPNQLSIQYAVTGVGMISTVYHLMKLLQTANFDLVIQLGIAGSFNNQLQIGTAVNIEKEGLPEMGVVEHNAYLDIFQLQLADPNQFPFENGALPNPHHHLLAKTGLSNCVAVTNNQISTNHEVINRYKNNYGASIESMEGAAFHYVALIQKIPFLQIRGISNLVGVRDKQQWKIKEGIQAYTTACINLLEQL